MIRLFWTRQQKIVSSQEIGGGIRQPTKPGRTQLVPFIVTWFYSFGKKSLHKSFIYVSKNRLGTMEIRVRERVNLNPKSPQMFRTDYRDCLPNESLSFTALHMSGHSLSVLLLLLSLIVFSIIILIIIIIFSLLLLLGHFLSALLLLLSLVIFSSFPSLRCGRITMHKNLASLKLTFNVLSLGVGCYFSCDAVSYFADRPCLSFSPLPLGWPTIPLSTLTALIFPSKGL